MYGETLSLIHASLISVLDGESEPLLMSNDDMQMFAPHCRVVTRDAWKCNSAAAHPRLDLQCWASLRMLYSF